LKLLKRSLLSALKGLGVSYLVGNSRWRQNRLAILCYHSVSLDDEHLWDPRCYVPLELLEQRLQLLKDLRCRVLPLGEALERLYQGKLEPRSVAITFDDGTYDFYSRAWPRLKRYGYPATVYLTTYYCYHPRPVFGMFCYYLMWKGRKSRPDLATEAGRANAASDFIAQAEKRGLSVDEKDQLAERIARELKVDYDAILRKRILQLMTPAEVSELVSQGLDVQLHTHRHRTPRDRDLFAREINENREAIEQMAGNGSRPVHFCYPSGVCSPEFLPWLKELDVVSATTCQAGLASRSDHPLMLPRVVDTCGLSPLELEAWILGVRELVGGRRAS
jgi:peptidoglycan/xylan/chitin deacetylase (PgdA/CDA1 family)